MRTLALGAAAAILLACVPAAAAEVDEEKKEQVVDTVRRLVESHEKGDVRVEPRKRAGGADEKDEADRDEADRELVITRRVPDEAEEKTRKAGDRRADLDLRKVPVSDALDAFGRMTGITIILDPKAVDQVGDAPINLKVSDMPLGTALGWICRLAGLDYELRDGAIFVSTPERLSQKESRLRIYDVRDLVLKLQDFPGPSLSLTEDGDVILVDPWGMRR